MSHDRSFTHMSVDELTVKQAFDTYRLRTLQEGVLAPIKRWGVGGLDESLYALAHKATGSTEVKKGYLRDQIRLTKDELATRTEKPGDSYTFIVATDANPATFWTLRQEREALRRCRVKEMWRGGERLYPSERFRLLDERVRDTGNGFLDLLGDLGEAVRSRLYTIIAAGCVAGAIATGVQWSKAANIYDSVAHKYVTSSPIGPHSLPLKRKVPSQANAATVALTYTSEVSIEDDDGDEIFHIPEKKSDPVVGRMCAANIEAMIMTHLSPAVLQELRFDAGERAQLERVRDASASLARNANISLAGAYDNNHTYGLEIGLIRGSSGRVQEAVEIMESHMDQFVVADEEKAHEDVTFWEWSTYGLGGIGALFGYNAIRQRRRREYYGY